MVFGLCPLLETCKFLEQFPGGLIQLHSYNLLAVSTRHEWDKLVVEMRQFGVMWVLRGVNALHLCCSGQRAFITTSQ